MVDENEVVKGIVSLSDILQALVLTSSEEGKGLKVPERWVCNRGVPIRDRPLWIFLGPIPIADSDFLEPIYCFCSLN